MVYLDIYKRVQSNDRADLYRNDGLFRTNVKMIGAIAFVAIVDVVETFERLANHCRQNEQVILDYFETNYRRVTPLFEHDLWSVFKQPATNHKCGRRMAQRFLPEFRAIPC